MPTIEIKINDICIGLGIFALGYMTGEIVKSIEISNKISKLYEEGYAFVDTNCVEVQDFDIK